MPLYDNDRGIQMNRSIRSGMSFGAPSIENRDRSKTHLIRKEKAFDLMSEKIDGTECPICLRKHEKLLILDCSEKHHICRTCFQGIIMKSNSIVGQRCPFCRQNLKASGRELLSPLKQKKLDEERRRKYEERYRVVGDV